VIIRMADLFELLSGIIIGIIPIPLDFLKVAIFPGFAWAGIMVLFLTYYERKLLAKLQLRVGPYYAGRFEGIFQMIADTIKLLFKEIIMPCALLEGFFCVLKSRKDKK